MLSHWSFNLHFPHHWWNLTYLFMFIGHLDILFCKLLVQIFCLFSIGCLFFSSQKITGIYNYTYTHLHTYIHIHTYTHICTCSEFEIFTVTQIFSILWLAYSFLFSMTCLFILLKVPFIKQEFMSNTFLTNLNSSRSSFHFLILFW